MKQQSKLLKVISILLIIFGAFGLIGNLASIFLIGPMMNTPEMVAVYEAAGVTQPGTMYYVLCIQYCLLSRRNRSRYRRCNVPLQKICSDRWSSLDSRSDHRYDLGCCPFQLYTIYTPLLTLPDLVSVGMVSVQLIYRLFHDKTGSLLLTDGFRFSMLRETLLLNMRGLLLFLHNEKSALQ